MKFKIFLSTFLKYGTLLTSLGFIFTVSLQIYARFFLTDVPPWTEEASRMLFIYAISFASGLAYRGNYFVYLEAFYVGFSKKMKKVVDLVSPTLSFLLFGITACYAVDVFKMGFSESSPSLQIVMAIPFFSLLVLSFSVSFYSLLSLLKKIKYWKS
jgi:TRAP-type C4-dicarboxylate transport system permease small subunit